MADVLVVTGTCGVGKTTLCQAWAMRRRGAAISGDEVRHWIVCDELRQARGFQHHFVMNTTIAAAIERGDIPA